MKDIKNILFDLGGVLYHIDYNLTKVAFEKLGVNDFNTHYSQQQQNKLFDNLETGKISSKEFISKMLEIIPHSKQEDIVDAWNALLLGFTKENLKLLECLSGKYKLYLLSNTNAIHIEKINSELQDRFGRAALGEFFEKTYLSHEIGRRKPDIETFEWLLKDAGIKAEETLFIEDSIQHVESADKVGIKTVLWGSNKPITAFFLDKAQ
ncbi:MAG: HAD family phosphatase [Flavobacteriales bacterium]|nr:HAD family phosphatase [Flavobacteriales bacterium]